MTEFIAVDGSTIWDVCLNTYGDLNLLGKLMDDNNFPGVETYPTAGQKFLFDETLVSNQQTFRRTALSGEKYATKRYIGPLPTVAGLIPTIDADGTEVVSWLFEGSAVFRMSIDWGDGTRDEYSGASTYTPGHTYADPGLYEANIVFSDFALVTRVRLNNGINNSRITGVINAELLTSLTTLDLSRNLFASFDPTVALPGTLRILNLKKNSLTVFDPVVSLPGALEQLDLSYNALADFTPGNAALPDSIEIIDLSYNSLTAFFSAAISMPGNLLTLRLQSNLIVAFAPQMAFPTGIEEIDVSFNAVASISITSHWPLSLSMLRFNNNALSVSEINALLINLAGDLASGTSGSLIMNAQSPPAAPTGAGATAKSDLISQGYTVTTD